MSSAPMSREQLAEIHARMVAASAFGGTDLTAVRDRAALFNLVEHLVGARDEARAEVERLTTPATTARIRLGDHDEPPPGSAVVAYRCGSPEIWAHPVHSSGRWYLADFPHRMGWTELLDALAGAGADGPYLLTEGNADTYGRGWRAGRIDLHHAIASHIEGLALDPPPDGGASDGDRPE